jgi:hypothetical protein
LPSTDVVAWAGHSVEIYRQAITCYLKALDLLQDLGDHHIEATIITHLGDTHHAADNLPAAREAWQHALTILQQLDHPDARQVRAKLEDLATPARIEDLGDHPPDLGGCVDPLVEVD